MSRSERTYSVGLDEEVVDLLLLGGLEARGDERGSEDLVDVLDGGEDTYLGNSGSARSG
jgi:hypothetical protein